MVKKFIERFFVVFYDINPLLSTTTLFTFLHVRKQRLKA